MSQQVGLLGGGGIPPVAKAFMLIPNTKNFMQGRQIRKLPYIVAEMSVEAQKKFIDVLNSANKRIFRVLSGNEKEQWLQKSFEEAQKLIPPGHYTEKIFVLIKSTGLIIVAVVVGTMNNQSRL